MKCEAFRPGCTNEAAYEIKGYHFCLDCYRAFAGHAPKVITEADIIAARQRVAAAEAKGEQQDFADALLASPDLEPDMIRTWLDASVRVKWCACEDGDHSRIVCAECGLPPYWRSVTREE